MKPGIKSGSHWALLTILVLLEAGCSYTVKFDTRLALSPAVEQIPLHVGVYYSPEFVEYTKKAELIGCGPNGRKDKWGIFYMFPVGTTSRDLFDQIVASMFAKVTKTSNPPQSLTSAPSLDNSSVLGHCHLSNSNQYPCLVLQGVAIFTKMPYFGKRLM